jgi:ATP-dependent Clp protease adapter protein ClpS
LSFFCSLVGYRLLFNRPHRRGSVLSPVAWRMLAGFFWTSGLFLAGVMLWHRDYFALVAILLFGALGFGCLQAARAAGLMAVITSMPSMVYSPEASLVRMEGFVPAGFSCGVEILNDNVTHMVFVVQVLRERLGMDKNQSVDTMLAIHRNGGVVLPTSTPEEAARIAEAVTADARARNFSLVCRAVSAN